MDGGFSPCLFRSPKKIKDVFFIAITWRTTLRCFFFSATRYPPPKCACGVFSIFYPSDVGFFRGMLLFILLSTLSPYPYWLPSAPILSPPRTLLNLSLSNILVDADRAPEWAAVSVRLRLRFRRGIKETLKKIALRTSAIPTTMTGRKAPAERFVYSRQRPLACRSFADACAGGSLTPLPRLSFLTPP